jgi:glycosyltransferase involved in cell wall biosynthesis
MKYRFLIPGLLFGGGPRNVYTLCGSLRKKGFDAQVLALIELTKIPRKLGGYSSQPHLNGAKAKFLPKPLGLINQVANTAANINKLLIAPQLLTGAASVAATAESACYIATAWQTAYVAQTLAELQNRPNMYYAQAYESTFSKAKVYQYFASKSYTFPLVKFTQSAWLKKFLEQHYGGTTYYLGMGINHDVFRPSKDEEQKRNIVTIARRDANKGFKVFLDAITELRKKRTDFKVVIIGEKEALGIQRISFPFEFAGWINQDEELARHYQGSIFVNTGIHEALPMPPIEAMACGATLVMTNMAGAMEYTREEENCLLAPIGNAKKIAERLDEVLSSESLRERLWKNAISTANRYTWTSVVNKFKDMVRQEEIE